MHQTVKSHMSMQLKPIKGFSCQPTVLNLSKLDQLMETTKKLKKSDIYTREKSLKSSRRGPKTNNSSLRSERVFPDWKWSV